MPLIAWINEIFPEAQAPYTLKEITQRLQSLYHPSIKYSRVHRAWAALHECAGTRELVEPLNDDQRYLQFSHEAARRIARRVTHSKPPPPWFNTSEQKSELKRNSNAN